MLITIRHSRVVKALWGIMALYLLNISVDTADPYPDHIPEDLSFNDQESIVEIILEKILGFEDAIKEYDDHDSEHEQKKTRVHADFNIPVLKYIALLLTDVSTLRRVWQHAESALAEGVYRLDPPPPKS